MTQDLEKSWFCHGEIDISGNWLVLGLTSYLGASWNENSAICFQNEVKMKVFFDGNPVQKSDGKK